MTALAGSLLLLAVFATSWLLTRWFRAYAMRHQLLDVPNARSSHTVATPRGGGVAFVLSTIAAVIGLAVAGLISPRLTVGLVGSGLLVAGVGYLDDRRPIPARWRLLSHGLAAAWFLGWLGGLPSVVVGGLVIDPEWWGYGIAVLYLVWVLNLTNFMDGIDGIAALEGVMVCLGGSFLFWVVHSEESGLLAPLVLSAALLGFLVWNWPPAKIFMGDAGSGFLGLMLGAGSVVAARSDPVFLWSGLILLGVFLVDATMTLLRRIARGERFYEAHRSHAYQHAAIRWGSHRRVTLTVGLINLLWLLPWALLVALKRVDGVLALCIAYAPLCWVAAKLGAGVPKVR